MSNPKNGDCVKIPDGRIGRVRDIEDDKIRVRVMRKTSHTHQFLWVALSEVAVVACPKGWMSPEGYNNYLKVTLTKMRHRNKDKRIDG